MTLIKPQKLETGDTIGIIAPSRKIEGFKKQIDDGVKILKQMGYRTKFSKNFNKEYYQSAGTVQDRIDDLHTMFSDPNIGAIFCALGGDSCNQLLSHIDYELIRNNPKIFIGFSDVTHLCLALNKKSSLMTFHGPSLKDLPKLTERSLLFLNEQLSGNGLTGNFPPDLEVIKPGKVYGPLVGGNLFVLNALVSSEYMPKIDDKILFWEEIDDNLSAVEFQLYQLRLTGVLERISGMVVGHIDKPECSKEKSRPLSEILLDITRDNKFPIIKVDYFGHNVSDFYSMPIGSTASIDTQNKLFELK